MMYNYNYIVCPSLYKTSQHPTRSFFATSSVSLPPHVLVRQILVWPAPHANRLFSVSVSVSVSRFPTLLHTTTHLYPLFPPSSPSLTVSQTSSSTSDTSMLGRLSAEIIGTIRRFIAEDRLPHMLFYGPPGTGKTSTIVACARQLYGQ